MGLAVHHQSVQGGSFVNFLELVNYKGNCRQDAHYSAILENVVILPTGNDLSHKFARNICEYQSSLSKIEIKNQCILDLPSLNYINPMLFLSHIS